MRCVMQPFKEFSILLIQNLSGDSLGCGYAVNPALTASDARGNALGVSSLPTANVLRTHEAHANFTSFKLGNDWWNRQPANVTRNATNRPRTMKTAGALLIAALLTAWNSASAQTRYGTVFLNNYDSGKGIFWYCELPAPAGSYVELLGGPNRGSLSLIASTDPSNPTRYTIQDVDRDALGPGTGSFFDYGFGEVPGMLPGSIATFRLRAWFGSPTFDSASDRSYAEWTQQTGTNPDPPGVLSPAVLRIPYPIFFCPDCGGICIRGPRSQTASAGAAVTFRVDVEIYVCALANYQWTKSGVDLNFASSSHQFPWYSMITLTNVSRTDAGDYAVTVFEGCGRGNVTRLATLRVLVPQRFGTPWLLADGRVRLPFRDQDGNVATLSYATNYFVMQTSTNLVEWQTVSGSLSLTNGFLVFEDNTPFTSASRFYRIFEQ